MFKKAILPLAAVTALSAFAAPAAAQSVSLTIGYGQPAYGYGHGGYDRGWDRGWDRIENRFRRIDHLIDQGVRSRRISQREAYSLRMEFRQLIELERRYSHGGLSQWERRDLEQRFNRLEARIRYDRRDRDHRRW